MRVHTRRMILALLGFAVIPACGSSHGGFFAFGPPSGRYAYVANNDGTISIYSLKTSLGLLNPSGFAATYVTAPNPTTQQKVTLAQGGQFAWAVTPGTPPTLSTYSPNATTGALTAVSAAVSLSPLQVPGALAVDPFLRFAYLADNLPSTTGVVQVYSIGGTGVLTPVGGSVPTGAGMTHPLSLAVHPSGNFLYVANNGTNNVSAFSVGPGGGLTAITLSPFPTGTGPIAIAIDSSGQFLFVLNQTSGDLWVYSMNGFSGVLTTVSGSPFPTGLSSPSILAVDPLDRFVWVGAASSIQAFVLNTTTGFLSPSGSAFSTAPFSPGAMEVDPSGLFALVPSTGGGGWVLTYPIGTTGILGPAVAQSRTHGSIPSSIALSSGSAVTYTPSAVYSASSAGIAGFFITPTSGILNPMAGSPFSAGLSPSSIAVDPFNRFAYATDQSGGGSPVISQYSVTFGGLSPIAAPLALASASQVAVDPSGQFAFTASGPGTISRYFISQVTGALANSPASTLGVIGANALAIDPIGTAVLAFDSTGVNAGIKVLTIDAAAGTVGGPAATLATGATTSIAFSQSGRLLFYGSGSNVGLVTITSGGYTVSGTAATITGTVTSIALDPTDSFLYATSSTGRVFGFTVSFSGTLTAMVPASEPTGSAPIGMMVDPSGQFAFNASSSGGTLWAYTLGGLGGGQLLTASGSPYAIGATATAPAVGTNVQ